MVGRIRYTGGTTTQTRRRLRLFVSRVRW
jgi:hypothetical protein